jgi:hypothetical protein
VVRQPAACSASFCRARATDPTDGAAPPRYTASGPRPEIGGTVTSSLGVQYPHRAEAADTQRSSSKGAKARGHVANGHVARTAKVPIDCYAVSRIVPDKVGTIQRIRASDAG